MYEGSGRVWRFSEWRFMMNEYVYNVELGRNNVELGRNKALVNIPEVFGTLPHQPIYTSLASFRLVPSRTKIIMQAQ